jgi:hypothetical protein
LSDSFGFGIGLTGRGTVPLELVSKPQRPESSTAESQVIGLQVLQGAVRLVDHGFGLVVGERQRGSYGGNLPIQVAGLVIEIGILQGLFSLLEFLFHTSCPSRI